MRQTMVAILLVLVLSPAAMAQTLDLGVAVADSPDPVIQESPLTYTVTATNTGPSVGPNVAVLIQWSPDLSFTSIDTPAGWTCVPQAPPARVIDCTTPSFGVGSAVFTLHMISPEVPGTPTSVSAGITLFLGGDTNVANNFDTETTTVVAGPLLAGTKSVASGGQLAGQNVVYSIVLTQSGAFPVNDATGPELIDDLPATLTLLSAGATSGTAFADLANNRVTWNGSVGVGQSVTITITALVEPQAAGSPVVNQASIHYDRNGDGTHDVTALTNPAAFTPAGATSGEGQIPTASTWGLLLLAGMLAVVAVMKM
jgi:hypothetical protein